MSQIEKRLVEDGWKEDRRVVLVIGTSLLHLLDHEYVDDDGLKHEFTSAVLYHKGDMYIFQWSRWDQDTKGKDEGDINRGATHFSPGLECVEAGFSHVLTVNLENSTICLWKDEKE